MIVFEIGGRVVKDFTLVKKESVIITHGGGVDLFSLLL